MHPLQVEGGGDQVSFAFDDPKATKQELTEAHLVGNLKDLYEESIDLAEKAFPEGGNGVMVGMVASGSLSIANWCA
jgi:hypothetical protein